MMTKSLPVKETSRMKGFVIMNRAQKKKLTLNTLQQNSKMSKKKKNQISQQQNCTEDRYIISLKY